MDTATHPAWPAISWLDRPLWGLSDAALLARLRSRPRAAIALVVDDDWSEPDGLEALMRDVSDFVGESH